MKETRYSVPARFYFSVKGHGKKAKKRARKYLASLDSTSTGDFGLELDMKHAAIFWFGDGTRNDTPKTIPLEVEDEGEV